MLERAAEAGEKLAGEGLDQVRESREALLEARGQADQLIAASERAQKALDRASENVELALARAEPLQGLTERIARLNERLPGRRAPAAQRRRTGRARLRPRPVLLRAFGRLLDSIAACGA